MRSSLGQLPERAAQARGRLARRQVMRSCGRPPIRRH
jgi:hypothetical protein